MTRKKGPSADALNLAYQVADAGGDIPICDVKPALIALAWAVHEACEPADDFAVRLVVGLIRASARDRLQVNATWKAATKAELRKHASMIAKIRASTAREARAVATELGGRLHPDFVSRRQSRRGREAT